MFTLSGLILAIVCGYWTYAVINAEMALRGGPLPSTRHSLTLGGRVVSPYKAASIFPAVFIALVTWVSTQPAWRDNNRLFEVAILIVLSFLFAGLIAWLTTDPAQQTPEDKKDEDTTDHRTRYWRVVTLFSAAPYAGFGLPLGIMAVSLVSGIAINRAVQLNPGGYPLKIILATLLIAGGAFAGAFLTYGVLRLIKAVTGSTETRWINLSSAGSAAVSQSTDTLTGKLEALWAAIIGAPFLLHIFILLWTLFIIVIASTTQTFQDNVLTTPNIALMAMTGALGPLVLILCFLRDIVERLLALVLMLPRILRFCLGKPAQSALPFWDDMHSKMALESFNEHSRPAMARRIGRLAALIVFAWLLYGTPGGWTGKQVEQDYKDVYAIRTIAGSAPEVAARPTLTQALNSWAQQHFPDIVVNPKTAPDSKPKIPVVIVGAAGGASRAGAWVLHVLTNMEQDWPLLKDPSLSASLNDYIFAISGVSGGSLGAVTYFLDRAGCRIGADDKPTSKPRASNPPASNPMSQADLLWPSIHQYFWADALRRFDFFGLLSGGSFGFDVDDRNEALERSFARHWEQDWAFDCASLDVKAPLNTVGLLALQRRSVDQKRHVPHLLLNGYDPQSGRRVLTATFSLPRAKERADVFPSIVEFFTEAQRDIPLTTAVMNSARFPFISPAGRYCVRRSPGSDGCGCCGQVRRRRQVIDGGYFENLGVATAMDVIKEIQREEVLKALRFQPVPFLLTVSNAAEGKGTLGKLVGHDTAKAQPPSDFEKVTARCGAAYGPVRQATGTLAKDPLSELMAPLFGVVSVRSGLAAKALTIARRDFCSPAGGSKNNFFHIGLPAVPEGADGRYAAPMNWVLDARVGAFFKVAYEEKSNHKETREFLSRIAQIVTDETHKTDASDTVPK